MSYTPLSGKGGSLALGSGSPVSHRLKQWTFRPETNIINATALGATADGDSNVWEQNIAGVNRARITVRGLWDNGNQPLGAAAFRVGLTVILTLTIITGVTIACNAVVANANVDINVDGEAGFEAELAMTGAPTYPS